MFANESLTRSGGWVYITSRDQHGKCHLHSFDDSMCYMFSRSS